MPAGVGAVARSCISPLGRPKAAEGDRFALAAVSRRPDRPVHALHADEPTTSVHHGHADL